ncbi:MAG TPA: VOC family protein [Acidimicrobiales bacterium]
MNRTPLATRPAGRAVAGPGGRAVVRSLRRVVPGAPAWVDVGTTAGTATAARFYCGLFGWRVVARHRPLDDGVGYWIFRADGRDVGGLAPAGEASWSVYVAVVDVDATARAVAAHGGAVLAGPLIVDAGRMAVCADPEGATFVLWEAEAAGPAGRGGCPDGDPAPCPSCQLACRDVAAAARFYGAVFGWETRPGARGSGARYAELVQVGTGRCAARVVATDDRWPAGGPARWMVHLEVADVERTAARAAELGGTVSVAPFDVPDVGRLAVLGDPEDAVFSVLQAA